MPVSQPVLAVSHAAMISVRRIAIAVGTVAAAFALVVLAVASYEHYAESRYSFGFGLLLYSGEWWRAAAFVFGVMGIVPRWRRHLATAIALVTAVMLLLLLHALALSPFHPAPELFDTLAMIFLLAALALLTRGRLPMVAPIVIVTATVLAIALPILVLLVITPFGERWYPPTWNDARHLHPLRASELCRGVTLFDPKLHAFLYAAIDRVTRNFRGEHRPMVLLRGEFREGSEWLPPDALSRLLVDDRDPALHPCDGARGHPVWPRGDEPVHDRLTF